MREPFIQDRSVSLRARAPQIVRISLENSSRGALPRARPCQVSWLQAHSRVLPETRGPLSSRGQHGPGVYTTCLGLLQLTSLSQRRGCCPLPPTHTLGHPPETTLGPGSRKIGWRPRRPTCSRCRPGRGSPPQPLGSFQGPATWQPPGLGAEALDPRGRNRPVPVGRPPPHFELCLCRPGWDGTRDTGGSRGPLCPSPAQRTSPGDTGNGASRPQTSSGEAGGCWLSRLPAQRVLLQ